MVEKKLKMKNRRFCTIWTTVISILLIIGIVGSSVAYGMSDQISSYLGRGERHVVVPEGAEDWDTEYYTAVTSDGTVARENSEAVADKVGNEGEVLMKNNGILPLKEGSTVTPFGYGYLNPAYGGTGAGSSSTQHAITPEVALARFFTVEDAAARKMQAGNLTVMTGKDADSDTDAGALTSDNTLSGYDISVYQGIEKEIAESVGIVFISRMGNEGSDKRMTAYEDGTPHYLALTSIEKETIRFAKENCGHVVVILNTPSAMELSELMTGEYEADAILWLGNPGARGFWSMADILVGNVNPSGRLVDTWASDFIKDPTYQNMGVFTYSNSSFVNTSTVEKTGETLPSYYIEYQEGIYVGYRYYETAAVEDPSFVYGTLDGKGGMMTPGAVCYPFGYGLSYTSFTQEITSFEDEGDEIHLTVKVTNTGNTAGKDVVQLYVTAPYTSFDVDNKIEKSAVVLLDFEKTKLLEAGESQEIEISLNKEDMASYCYTRDNGDGTKGCYVLEEGNYILSIRANSHEVLEQRETVINETIWYDNSNPRQSELDAQSAWDDEGNSLGYPAATEQDEDAIYVAATNAFEECNEYVQTEIITLSRSDWNGTQPKTQEGRTKEASDKVLKWIQDARNFDYETDPEFGNVEGSLVYESEMPVSGVDNGLTLADMRGKSYYDSDWELLLDQIDWEGELKDIKNLINVAGYQTSALKSIGKPATADMDGATSLKLGGLNDTASWMCYPIVAATWNKELAYEVGEAFGQEALTTGTNGWYAPAMNIHRSPFSGRNFEYCSEDGVISGRISAAVVSGAGDQGLYCYIKHFALNDQESNRQYFLHTWADEQTIREIYLKAFEICVKESRMNVKYISDDQGTMSTKVMRAASGVMTSQNCIGSTICFNHYGLQGIVLRSEWGYTGAILSDLYFATDTWIRDKMIRTGGDMYMMVNVGAIKTYGKDFSSATARNLIRECIHHIAYMQANSSVTNYTIAASEVYYDMAPWMKLLIAVDVCIVCFALTMVVVMVRRTKDCKLHPEKYKA